MSEDDGSASWNPALRPNSEPSNSVPTSSQNGSPRKTIEDGQSHDRPVKSQLQQAPITSTEDELGADVAWSADQELGDDFLNQGESTNATPSIGQDGGSMALDTEPAAKGFTTSFDEEPKTPPEPSDFPVSEIAEGRPQPKQDDLLARADLLQQPDAKGSSSDVHSPSDTYEFQGESTALEDAVQEDATAPLSADNSATIDWDTNEVNFDLGATDSSTFAVEDQKTEPGLRSIPEQEQTRGDRGERSSAQAIEWDTAEHEDFSFDAAFADSGKSEQLGGLEMSNGNPPHSTSQPQDTAKSNQTQADLDALWQAALDDDELLEDPEPAESGAFFVDDGEGFLEDDTEPAAQPVQSPTSHQARTSSINKYAPPTQEVQAAPVNAYAPSGPQFTDLSYRPRPQQAQTSPYGNAPPQSLYSRSSQQPTRPAPLPSAQSFADKNKGGYASPYDLPVDLMPRKRPSMPVMARAQSQAVPPRSSSVLNPDTPERHHPPPPPPVAAGTYSRPGSSRGNQASAPSFPPTGPSPPTGTSPRKGSGSEFFADLPVTSRSRPSSQAGRYTPQPSAGAPPPANVPPPSQAVRVPPTSQPQDHRHPLATEFRSPEIMPPYAEKSPNASTSSLPMPPPSKSRYSPAPPPAAPLGARYSPAPPNAPPGSQKYSATPPAAHHAPPAAPPPAPASGASKPPPPLYAPRTSSPLAYQATAPERHDLQQNEEHVPPPAVSQASMGPASADPVAPTSWETAREPERTESSFNHPAMIPSGRTGTPPPPRSGPTSATSSPRKRSQVNYAPQYQPQHSDSAAAAPARPRTQSPGSTMKNQHLGLTPVERPSSARDMTSPPPATSRAAPVIPHRRMFSRDLSFITPADDQAADQLERWKGHPIFTWALGGTVLTSFPKQTPRYGTGQAIPMIKCGPGEVKVHSAKEMYPLPESISKFPGPLRSKSKKKEVVSWLKSCIGIMELEFRSHVSNRTLAAFDLKRAEEKLLLWKVMHLFVENDGVLEGTPAIELAVRSALSPDSHDLSELTTPYTMGVDSVSASQHTAHPSRSDPADPRAFEFIRNHLEKGDREKAAWQAADSRLWAHAMLISSTLGNDIWKQVVQEFVRREIQSVSSGNEPIAALYEVFAGNWEESIDELVPASARAGFHMVSKSEGVGATKDARAGLEQWRSTLLLILSNRSNGDVNALLSLGKLLTGYGRAEAAHICFMFARSIAYFSGADDPLSNVVLIGADHVHHIHELGQDLEPVLLTEVYEFGLSLASTSTAPVLPHLQAYKLQHAHTLAEYGHRTEAQLYCDAIANAMKSSTRSSPYYHAHFISQLDDLTKRLSQSPKDSSASWISKPTMDKMSVNMWAKFSNFVAGDDSDNASTGSGVGADVGPFAKVAGGTPTISRSPSNADMYGPYSASNSAVSQTAPLGDSRYGPSSSYPSRSPQDSFSRPKYEPTSFQPGRPSLESENAYAPRRSSDQPAGSESPHMPASLANTFAPTLHSSPSQRGRAAFTPSPYAPGAPQPSKLQLSHAPNLYEPTPPPIPGETSSSYAPPAYDLQQVGAGSEGLVRGPSIELSPPPTSDGPPASGYAPPTGGSFEPPSYQPYEPDVRGESLDASQLKKTKSVMDLDDDDDELEKRAAALKKQQQSQADREADDAFRKAAEADAAKSSTQKKGWFGSWFKKDPNAAPGPIRAKLGEESSFYWDADLKKWVNKKGGDAAAGPTAPTPPPPRGGPGPRSTSGAPALSTVPPPSGPPHLRPLMAPPQGPQRSASMPPRSAVTDSGEGTPPRSESPAVGGGAPPPVLSSSLPGASIGPPSRPSTALSNASSIDDLMPAPGARRGGTRRGKKGQRYVDVMAQ